MKKLVLFLLVATMPVVTFGQPDMNVDSLFIKGKKELHQAVSSWTETSLINARAYFERLLINSDKAWLAHYYIALVDYRLTSFYFSKNDKNQAKKFIDDGIDHLSAGLEEKKDFADAHNLLSALYGNKIGINPFLSMTLGPKSGKEMQQALSLAPGNPRNYLVSGWSAFYTPKMFGGGKDKAEKHFNQAIACFDSFQVTDPTLPDWGHEEAYAWLGIVQAEKNDLDAAKKSYEMALQINPDYGYVSYVLLPKLEKEAKNN